MAAIVVFIYLYVTVSQQLSTALRQVDGTTASQSQSYFFSLGCVTTGQDESAISYSDKVRFLGRKSDRGE